MVEIRQTPAFASWLNGLRDEQVRARIQVRMDCLALGLVGDMKPVGGGVSELRIDYGPGYRVYFKQGRNLAILLVGGDKRTQDRDIKRAQVLARNV